MSGYVSLGQPRFVVEHARGREQLRVNAQGSIFVGLFLVVWLCGWTIGGVAAMTAFRQHPNGFLIFWLCGWALGWLYAAFMLAWRFTGAELLRPVGQDLELERRILGFGRSRLYRGTDIRNLAVHTPVSPTWGRSQAMGSPFFYADRWGTVSFDYGARSIYLAGGLDNAEARGIVDWLAQRLPRSARTAEGGAS